MASPSPPDSASVVGESDDQQAFSSSYPLHVNFCGWDSSDPVPATFGSCALHYIRDPAVELRRNEYTHCMEGAEMYWDNKDTLTVRGAPTNGSAPGGLSGAGDYVGTIPLGHYRECPFHTNDTEPELFDEPFPTDQSVRVAAGILVVSGGHVLVTRRAASLRTFPRLWVVPGGHVEIGETLHEAAAREVLEETGVAVSPSDVSVHCGWESAYPQSFRLGTPTRQHMIIYFIAEVPTDENGRPPAITPQVEEVDCWAWLNVEETRVAVGKGSENPPATALLAWHTVAVDDAGDPIEAAGPIADETHVEYDLDLGNLADLSRSTDRLSTASRFCLIHWLATMGVPMDDDYEN